MVVVVRPFIEGAETEIIGEVIQAAAEFIRVPLARYDIHDAGQCTAIFGVVAPRLNGDLLNTGGRDLQPL